MFNFFFKGGESLSNPGKGPPLPSPMVCDATLIRVFSRLAPDHPDPWIKLYEVRSTFVLKLILFSERVRKDKGRSMKCLDEAQNAGLRYHHKSTFLTRDDFKIERILPLDNVYLVWPHVIVRILLSARTGSWQGYIIFPDPLPTKYGSKAWG